MFLIPHCTSKIGWILAGINGLNWTSLEEGRKKMNSLAPLRLFLSPVVLEFLLFHKIYSLTVATPRTMGQKSLLILHLLIFFSFLTFKTSGDKLRLH